MMFYIGRLISAQMITTCSQDWLDTCQGCIVGVSFSGDRGEAVTHKQWGLKAYTIR